MFFEGGNRGADVSGLLGDDVELYARGELALHVFELEVERIDDLDGIDTGLAADLDDDGWGALVVSEAAALAHTVFDLADVLDANRSAAHIFDDDVVEIFNGFDAAEGADTELGLTGDDAAAGGFDVFAHDGTLNLLGAEVVSVHLVDVQVDIDLTAAASLDVYDADAIDSFETAADDFVGDFSKVADGTGTGEGDAHDGIGVEIAFCDSGSESIGRELALGCGDFFTDIVDGFRDVAIQDEIDLETG